MSDTHRIRRRRLERLLKMHPAGAQFRVSREDLEALLARYGHNASPQAPQNPDLVRRIVRDRAEKGLKFRDIGYRYEISHVAAFRHYHRWRDWVVKNPVDKPTRA